MRVGSLFSGIGGFDLGFQRAGCEIVWQVEIEPFCREILARHFPRAVRHTDILDCCGVDCLDPGRWRNGDGAYGKRNHLRPVDIICAGVPCQDVSIAGKRAGLAGERTGLFYEFARILQELRPSWFVFENVPGLFSSNAGRDFAEILRVLMVECGYGLAWRVLDSRYFGVAQRRRRVFIVGCLGKPCPAEILFEPSSSSGDCAPCGEAGTDFTAPLGGGSDKTGRLRESLPNLAYCLREDPGGTGQGHNTTYAISPNMRNRSQGPANYVQQAISAKWAKGSSGPAGDEHHNLIAMPITGHSGSRGEDRDTYIASTLSSEYSEKAYRGDGSENIVASTLGSGDGGQHLEREYAVCAHTQHQERNGIERGHTARMDGDDIRNDDERAPSDPHGVRDFTGLPEGMDSPRYRALGNAVTVQVAEWIARRILAYEYRETVIT